jgi:hypothetical protein
MRLGGKSELSRAPVVTSDLMGGVVRRRGLPSIAVAGISVGILSGCAEQTCSQTLYEATCTQTNQWPDWMSDNPILWVGPLIFLTVVFGGWLIEQVGKSNETAQGNSPAASSSALAAPPALPTKVPASQLRIGDRTVGANGSVRVVRGIIWISADEVEITWDDESRQRLASTFVGVRLPPISE